MLPTILVEGAADGDVKHLNGCMDLGLNHVSEFPNNERNASIHELE